MLTHTATAILSLPHEAEAVAASFEHDGRHLTDQALNFGAVFTRLAPAAQLLKAPASSETGPASEGAHHSFLTAGGGIGPRPHVSSGGCLRRLAFGQSGCSHPRPGIGGTGEFRRDAGLNHTRPSTRQARSRLWPSATSRRSEPRSAAWPSRIRMPRQSATTVEP